MIDARDVIHIPYILKPSSSLLLEHYQVPQLYMLLCVPCNLICQAMLQPHSLLSFCKRLDRRKSKVNQLGQNLVGNSRRRIALLNIDDDVLDRWQKGKVRFIKAVKIL